MTEEPGTDTAHESRPRIRYGGPRLQPEHYEPAHVPVDVARYGVDPHTLPVGSPGKVGILELGFELRGPEGMQRTELVHHYQKSPLQIIEPVYYDPLRPDMPYTYLLTTGGGVLHNDRQRADLKFGPGTSAHVTTQAHTKLYRMESGYATSLVNVEIADGAYLEYLPDPVIPYVDSRFYQRVAVTLSRDATLVTGETIYAGRLTRGEHNAYAVFASDFEVRRPDGEPVAFDRARLVPREGQVGGLGILAGRDVVVSLFVVTPRVPVAQLAQVLHDTAAGVVADSDDDAALFGVSTLADDAGAWLRYVGDDTITATKVRTAAAAAVHELITGSSAPQIRK